MSLPHTTEELRGLCVDDASLRREALIAALRDKSRWPAYFRWNFATCKSCAMGLLGQLLGTGSPAGTHSAVTWISAELNIPREKANDLFNPLFDYEGGERNSFAYETGDCFSVTPAMVADRLEALHRQLLASASCT